MNFNFHTTVALLPCVPHNKDMMMMKRPVQCSWCTWQKPFFLQKCHTHAIECVLVACKFCFFCERSKVQSSSLLANLTLFCVSIFSACCDAWMLQEDLLPQQLCAAAAAVGRQ